MVMERRVEQQNGWIPVSPANFLVWKAQSRSYEYLAGYEYTSANLTAAESYPGAPERLASCLVTPDLFAALGAKPALGRVFTVDEAQPRADREVVPATNIGCGVSTKTRRSSVKRCTSMGAT